MLISAHQLVDRVRFGRARADEIAVLRRRLAAAPRPERLTPEARALAEELRRLREELAAAFSAVDSCSRCAHGHPLPHGRWDGGHCCGTRTELVFTDDEVAALRAAGTGPEDLLPPADGATDSGCALRGPTGCSLPPAHRPSICVRFICRELEAELRERGELRPLRAIAAELATAAEAWRRRRASAAPDVPPWEDG
jgi:hypothetical protein